MILKPYFQLFTHSVFWGGWKKHGLYFFPIVLVFEIFSFKNTYFSSGVHLIKFTTVLYWFHLSEFLRKIWGPLPFYTKVLKENTKLKTFLNLPQKPISVYCFKSGPLVEILWLPLCWSFLTWLEVFLNFLKHYKKGENFKVQFRNFSSPPKPLHLTVFSKMKYLKVYLLEFNWIFCKFSRKKLHLFRTSALMNSAKTKILGEIHSFKTVQFVFS